MSQNALDLLERLVLVESGTRNVEGVNAVQSIIKTQLEQMGFKSILFPNPKDAKLSGRLLVAELEGQTKNYVTLLCHADTVFEKNSGFSGFAVDHSKKYATGPGAIDNKGGVVVGIEAIRKYIEACGGKPKVSIRFVSSPNEEEGSIGFHKHFAKIGKESNIVLGLEPAFDDGSFVSSRRGNKWYDICVRGRQAHSGRSHRYGVNAAHELALKIARLQELTDYKKDLTLSVAWIEAGEPKFNVVCHTARAKLDFRFAEAKLGKKIHQKIEKIIKESSTKSPIDGLEAIGSYKLRDDCPPFSPDKSSKKLIAKALELIELYEKRKVPEPSQGAAADTSYMARPGLLLLDGLGACGQGMHEHSESVEISSLESRSSVMAGLLDFADSL